jgi:ABC-type molybdenum transport system ATPase subunit/photorepair protein PhrA
MATKGDRFGVASSSNGSSVASSTGAGAGANELVNSSTSATSSATSPSAAPDSNSPGATFPATEAPIVEVKNLNFTYGTATNFKPVLHDISFALPRGSRLLLVGDNGAGKSTLLRLLAGKHLHPVGTVTVLGKESFYDTALNLHR